MLPVLCVVAIFLGALSAGAHGDVDARANEGRTMTFVITTEGYGQREAALRYKYRTEDRTAEGGEDYRDRTGMVTFVASSSMRGIPAVTLEDDIEEGKERFVLVLYDREVRNQFPGDNRWRSSSSGYPRATKRKYVGVSVDQ